MNFMSNGLRQAEHLGADIADAERAERAADEADAHVLGALARSRPPPRGVSLSLIISLPVSASMKRDDRDRDRAAHAVRRDDQRDARLGAGVDIDRVVADAEAGDDREPSALRHALRGEAMGEQDQRVEVLELLGA